MPHDPPNPPPARVGWAEAPAAILSMAHASHALPVVCIAGAVGSGKSALARRLAESAPALLISTDDYLPDYHITPEHLRDEPDSAHLPELAVHVAELLAGNSVNVPQWSFHEHRRIGSRRVNPGGMIVIEGIHALHSTIDRVRTFGVLVEAQTAVRWARWEVLETSGQRGWGVERARTFFDQVADPTFARYADQYRARADLTVVNDVGLPRG